MAYAFYRGGYGYCFNATPHHCARHQRCGQSPPQGHPNTTLLGFRVALRRRAGLKINYPAIDGLQGIPIICNILNKVLRLGFAVRKAGTEAGRDKAWLANANFNLGFAFGGCCAQGKVRKEEGRGKARPANANFNLGFAFGGCCAQGKVGKEEGRGKARLANANFNLGFAFGGCCAQGWPRGRQGPNQIRKC